MIEWTYEQKRLRLIEENIVLLDVDAVVNAANKNLQLGGGVAGAIRNSGGPSIQEECSEIGPINVGEAALTRAGNLKAKYVIHAVGPIQGEGNEEEKLRNATLNSLRIAMEKEIESIAFPAISTGIFGFPLKKCSEIMIQTAINFLKEKKHIYPKDVIFCLFGKEAFDLFTETLNQFGLSGLSS